MINIHETAITELEQFGCPLMVLNKLDDKGIMWMDQLLAITPEELRGLGQVGKRRMDQTLKAVRLLMKKEN